MRITPCKTCGGQRLKKSALAVTVADKNIYEITAMSVGDLQKFLEHLTLTSQQELIGHQILKEIRARVGFLVNVGLEYLNLARATGTLSGGEAQRIVWRRRSAQAWWESRTFWTSPASASIRGTMTSSFRP